jgi:PAS domain S-box-containing protein
VTLVSFLKRVARGRVESGDRASPLPALGAVDLETLAAVSSALVRADDPRAVAVVLVDQARSRLDVEFAGVALVDEAGERAEGLFAEGPGGEIGWWHDIRLDLRTEPSGIATAAFEAAPLVVYDARHSPALNPDLVARVDARSAAFVPLVSRTRVAAVLVIATTSAPRAFQADELALLTALAGEAALALDRTSSSSALEDALARERLVAAIGRRVRSELDLDAVLRVAVEETGRALRVSRCFIRLGRAGGSMPVVAEWNEEGVRSVKDAADRLPVTNLAVRERRTVAVADVNLAPELDDPSLGGRGTLAEMGIHAVLATPIVVFDRIIGVFALHRTHAEPWSSEDVALAEAVAREAGLAIHTAQLLQENRLRLEQQVALLQAARVVTAELHLETVLKRLVDEVAPLLDASAADCYLIDAARGVLRCEAVHGLPEELLGFEFPAADGLAGEAIASGHPVVSNDYSSLSRPVHNPAYDQFQGVMVAPVTWSGETRGVLGVGTTDENRSFTESDAMLLEAFASLASLALRNAETFEERTRQARIERGFYRVAAILGQSLSIEETVDAVAEAACDALGADAAVVLTPEDRGLALAGSCSLEPEAATALGERALAATPVLAGAARDGRTLSAPALLGDDRFGPEWTEWARGRGFHSLLAIPLPLPRREDGGLVVVLFREAREIDDDDLAVGGHLAQAAKGALDRAELYEGERNARTLSQMLAQSGRLVASELDPAAVLDEAVERAQALLGADASTFCALEDEHIVFGAASGTDEDIAGLRLSAGGRPAGDVISSGRPATIADAGGLAGDPLLSAGHAGYLGVPLSTPEVEGVLAVYSRSPRVWREEEVDALMALAGGAASALANAELYQRVAQEKERIEAILSNIADGIVAVDREGKVVLWNSAAEDITSVSAANALGRRPVDVLHRRLESDGAAPPGDRLVSIARGSEDVWLSLTEAVMLDPSGAVSGRIFAFRDISGERAVEQMKSDFVSAVSHELRTPLTSIYGFAETLLRSDIHFGEDERRTFLGYIASEAERLTRIVDSLLNVARLDSGDLVVNLAPTDVRPVVSEVVAGIEEAGANGHSFVLEFPDEPLDAQADRDKLRQVLNQLVDNAVKYSPAGATVRISGRTTDGGVELEVSDEGLGIPHAEQERIFRKFYRGEAATRDGRLGGTGLGLFIAQGLVTAMGGRISVTSSEGLGSSFAVAIPAAPTPLPSK